MSDICAVIAVRNEYHYLYSLLSYLRKQGVDAVFIDNGSDDGSLPLLQSYLGDPVLDIVHLPYDDCFNLTSQLETKASIIRSLPHEWIIHQDADEILQSPRREESLAQLAARADEGGYTIIDFDEFVFLPDTSDGYTKDNYLSEGTLYYFFAPTHSRLQRMFKRRIFKGFGLSGGHKIEHEGAQVLHSNILRHFIVLSKSHACSKYLPRRFSEDDRAKGWHGNRVGLTEKALDFTKAYWQTSKLTEPTSREFSRSRPMKLHFWHW